MAIGTQPPTDRERIVAIEAVLPYLASKADVERVRADLERMQATIIKWQIGIGIATIGAVFAIVRFLG